jgi:SAM-dependent methyltransferase
MSVISGEQNIRTSYRDETLARNYIDERFREPLGALLHDRQVAFLKDAIARQRPRAMLEVAPGPARLTRATAPLVPQTVVVDASRAMLEQARARLADVTPAPSLIHGDAFRLPLAGPFDLAFSFRLIRHFEAADRRRLYRELHRVLRPGGLLVFDAVNRAASERLREQGSPGPVFDALLTADEVKEELRDSGFADITMAGVQYRYAAQYAVQVYVAPRHEPIARAAMEVIDRLGGEPLEWIVSCTRA